MAGKLFVMIIFLKAVQEFYLNPHYEGTATTKNKGGIFPDIFSNQEILGALLSLKRDSLFVPFDF